MKLAECTKTGKRISMNRLLLAEDNKKNRVIYNFDDLSSIGVVAKVEAKYNEEALEGDSGSYHIYHYHTKDLKTYFNEDRARLLAGKKILLRDRSPIYEFENGRIVKIEKCVYRNYSLYDNYDDEYLDIDFIYLNEFVTEIAPKKEKKKEKKKDTNAILIPLICTLIILLTIILGIITTIWGTVRLLLNPIFFICSVVANSIVIIIETECLEQLDKSLEIK